MGSTIVRIDRLLVRAEIADKPSQVRIAAIAVVSYPVDGQGNRRSETFSSRGQDVDNDRDRFHFKRIACAELSSLKEHLEMFFIKTEMPFRDANLDAVDIYPDTVLWDVDLFNISGPPRPNLSERAEYTSPVTGNTYKARDKRGA